MRSQNDTVPRFPFGKKVSENIYPSDITNRYIGLQNPQIGQIAIIKNIGKNTEHMAITGTRLGIFSISDS